MKRGIMTKEEMRQPSVSYQNLVLDNDTIYQNLANAIICVAADDYRLAMRKRDTYLLHDLEKFFYSDWYGMLTTLDPNKLLSKLRKEFKGQRGEKKSNITLS